MGDVVPLSVIALAAGGILLAGCAGGGRSDQGPSASGPEALEPTPPATCAVSPAGTEGDVGTEGGAVRLSRLPVFAWSGPVNSSIALRIAPATASVRVSARHLARAADAEFVGFGAGDSPSSELVVSGPFAEGEDLLGYVSLPEPGCWRFEIDADGDKQSITVYAYGEAPPADCAISEPMEVRPDIAPGLGDGPVWMIAGAAAEWETPDLLWKTIWIVDDAFQGEVRISGRRLDGDDFARFQGYHEYDNDRVSPDGREIILGPPYGRSKDRRGYVIYPSAGCWRFTAESDGQVIAQITAYLYDVVP